MRSIALSTLLILFLMLVSLAAAGAEPKILTSRNGEYSIVIVRDAGTDPDAPDGVSRAVHQYRAMKNEVYGDRGTLGRDEVADDPKAGFDGRTGIAFIVRNSDPARGFGGIDSLRPAQILLGVAIFYQSPGAKHLPLETRLTGHGPRMSIPHLLDEWERANPGNAGVGTRVEAGWFTKRKDAPEILMPFLLQAMDDHLLDSRAAVGNLYLQTNPQGLAPYYKRRMSFRQIFHVEEDPHIKDGRGVAVMHLSRTEVHGVPKRILSSMGLPAIEAFANHPLSDVVEEKTPACRFRRF